MSDLTKLAQDCGATIYRHRLTPQSPALAFGDEAWAKFCEVVSAQPAQAVPPGYVLVPVEPTEEMLAPSYMGTDGPAWPIRKEIYRAMIVAAQGESHD